MSFELYLPPENPGNSGRCRKTGRFLKGHSRVPHNKGKHPREYMSRYYYYKIRKNLEKGRHMKKPGVAKALGKSVVAIKDGKLMSVFPSSAEAGRKTGINASNIRAVCRGERRVAGGYRWFFEADDSWIDLVD